MLPIYRKTNIHVLIENVLASCLRAFLANVCHQLSHSRCMTVRQRQFSYLHHTIQADAVQNVAICLAVFFPVASHPNVAIDACAGRLLMMEHEIKSFLLKNV